MASQVLQRQSFKPGAKIFKEGDLGNMAYVVQEGEVEIVKVIDGVEQVLGTVGQGGIFGEMALIDAKPRMAAARAARGTTIICVSQQMFDDKLKKSDPFIRGLLNILADNVRSLSNK
ncbi:MAG: Crp/Fnr family transcriptional regulator [Rhodospirillaceae bacterium]|jgi:CRP/FNR family transcriptional regulator, cyclic AMP receptor protein|nr:Crp/Fnr family transcriptional regulator [Rhodospirillaceae bacterium]